MIFTCCEPVSYHIQQPAYWNYFKIEDILIWLSSKNKTFFCTYQVPEFLIGKPIYKIEDLRKYLINSLNRDKFDVLYIHPNLLFISWDKQQKNKRNVNKVSTNNNNIFKKIDDYNPTGNLLYNDNILSNINSKFN